MDDTKLTRFMSGIWDGEIVPVLSDYIRIPNKSPLFDPEWEKHGHMNKVVALLASSTFGFPRSERSERIVEAVHILDKRQVDFEYDGEIAVDVALDREKMALYPFCRLTDTANVLIMPAVHSAAIATKLLQQIGGVSMMGPFLVGLEKPVQIVSLGAKMSEIYNAALIAAL